MKALRIQAAESHLAAELAKSTELPEPIKENIRKQFKGKAAESVEIDTAIRGAKEMAAALTNSFPSVRVNKDERDNMREAVMATMFMNASSDVSRLAAESLGFNPQDRKYATSRFRGLKDMFSAFYGGINIEDVFNPRSKQAAESYAANVNTELLQDAMHQRALAAFRQPIWDDFKKISSPVVAADFRALHAISIGQFASTSTVVDYTADFTELALTGKEDTTLTLVGHGNLFSVRFDQILNDAINEVSKAPEKFALGYKKGLYDTVFNLLLNANTNVWAGDALGYKVCDVARGNFATATPLSGPATVTGRNAMAQIAELGSGSPSGIEPKYLIHTVSDFSNAYKITVPTAGQNNMTATADQSFGLERIQVPTWTNVQRWFLAANPAMLEYINVAYLNGKQEPEIAQENPLSGLNFTQMALEI